MARYSRRPRRDSLGSGHRCTVEHLAQSVPTVSDMPSSFPKAERIYTDLAEHVPKHEYQHRIQELQAAVELP